MSLGLAQRADAAAPARLTLALLGPIQIALDGVPLTFAYEKVQALLVFLAVEAGRAHRRAALADLLWPDQDEAAARHSLSQALFQVRHALRDGPDNPLLLVTRDTLRLSPTAPIWLDVAAFHQLRGARGDARQLRQASALYRGEFLEEWGIGESPAFEEWVLLTREQLRADEGDVLRQLTEPPALLGDAAAQACDDARRWVALDPLCEEAYRRLMRALAESGQRTAALAQFEHCRRVLQAELGIEPEPTTRALYDELKRSAPPPPQPALPPRDALPLPPTRLIDRERELGELTALLVDPATRLITITGPGGVGKTRLALHVAAMQAPAFRDGVCFVPLAPVREPALALAAVAQALGVPQNDGRPLDELVCAALAQRHLLLLLDNCEHLLPAATLVAGLLAVGDATTPGHSTK